MLMIPTILSTLIMKEMKNMEYYEMFELVEDVGQEYIGSRWVITQKKKHDGQKTQF